MNKCNCGPIAPYAIVDDPNYVRELEMKRPIPRIRSDGKWIKVVQEEGSVGLLFRLQAMDNRIREMQLYQRQRASCPNSAPSRTEKKDKKLKKEKKEKKPKKGKEKCAAVDGECATTGESERGGANAEAVPVATSLPPSTARQPYLRAHSASGPPLDVDHYPPIKQLSIAGPTASRVSVATAKSAASVRLERRNINYIRANAYALQSDRYRRSRPGNAVSEGRPLHLHKPGQVPKYLSALPKKTEPDSAKSKTDVSISKERLLTGQERRLVVDKLQSDLQAWYNELHRLPISMDTIRARSRKDEIEKQIDQINKRIDIFRRGNIFVEE